MNFKELLKRYRHRLDYNKEFALDYNKTSPRLRDCEFSLLYIFEGNEEGLTVHFDALVKWLKTDYDLTFDNLMFNFHKMFRIGDIFQSAPYLDLVAWKLISSSVVLPLIMKDYVDGKKIDDYV